MNDKPTEALQLAEMPQVPVASLLQTIIDKGATAESVGIVERLVNLHEKMEQKNAEKAFAAAFVRLQADLPVIVAHTLIPNRGKYERFEDLMARVGPLLVGHGFSVAFSQDVRENRILETCHLSHIAGVTKSNTFAVRTGKADTDTQADCKAATTAKRNAFCNALNLVIRQDVLSGEEGDAALEGEFITAEQVEYLKEQVKETASNEAAFLRMAGADKFEEICNGSYPVLVRALEGKKAKRL